MTRPTANTPSSRGTRTSPVAGSTRTSANWAPNACRAKPLSFSTSSVVSAWPVRPSLSMSSHAFTTADPHELVPIEPPARDAGGRALSPSSTRTRAAEVSRACAAILVSAVRAPVPMSAAAIRTTKPPSSTVAVAWDGRRRAG